MQRSEHPMTDRDSVTNLNEKSVVMFDCPVWHLIIIDKTSLTGCLPICDGDHQVSFAIGTKFVILLSLLSNLTFMTIFCTCLRSTMMNRSDSREQNVIFSFRSFLPMTSTTELIFYPPVTITL
uniref:Uncharacterized protein n=1 Tax=Trichuris muris TaxID=70415 RepID=A0A5S6Q6S7_TRIMR